MSGGNRRSARSRIKPSSDEDHHRDRKQIHRHPKERTKNSYGGSIRLINVNLKSLLGFGFLAFVAIVFLIYHHLKPVDPVQKQQLRVTTPLPAPKMMDLPQFQGKHRESLYWGTYRPQVYLGIRARTPQSLIAGLMWIGIKNGQHFLRHVCQDSDGLQTYGWTEHNGRDYGHQVLIDQALAMNTTFVKSQGDGSGYGGDWAIRFNLENSKSSLDENPLRTSHLFFYIADEGGYALTINREALGFQKGTLLASGSRADVGGWELHLDSLDNMEIHYSGFNTLHMHNLTELVQETLGVQGTRMGRLQLPDTSEVSPNVIVFQVSTELPFKMDVAFVSGAGLNSARVGERVDSLTGTLLTKQLKEKQKDFDDRFKQCFNLTEKVDSKSMIVGRAAIGNLLGGIGYFYGQSKISLPKGYNLQNGDKFVYYWPAALYTAVPSRSFFPRGFLWDEGFHQLQIWRWDIAICLDIIGHWLDLMNIDGWIPREQILGAEALRKVPEEFVLQLPTNANPPTLFLVLRDLIIGMERKQFTATQSNEISSFMEMAFIRLEAWFQWFNTSQLGKDPSNYYWHGRDKGTIHELNPKTLSSGLDDYPRASHPSEDERHLDLRCWMLLAANCMHSIAKLLQLENGLIKRYQSMANRLSDFDILNELHFDNVSGAYYDFGNHTEKVNLQWHEMKAPGSPHGNREIVRVVSEPPQLTLVPHVGYVGLFPLMMKIVPPASWILEKQLDLVSNRSTLWTDFGLRSLSKTSSLYMKRNTEHDPPYWRGPIWINMNYMILSALHHYSQADGPYRVRAQTIYKELRENLIGNIVSNYFQSGYLWEQYDQAKRGRGKGSHPFTGWTSLVLLIMAEAY